MFRPCAALALAILPLAAQADCGQPILSCTFDGGAKAVTVCLRGDNLTYEFGSPGMTADLKLSSPLSEGSFMPWPGVGNNIWESVAFQNSDTGYVVWSSLERNPDVAVLEGGIDVVVGEAVEAQLICDPGSVTDDFITLSNTMYDAGYCWNRADQYWSATGGCD